MRGRQDRLETVAPPLGVAAPSPLAVRFAVSRSRIISVRRPFEEPARKASAAINASSNWRRPTAAGSSAVPSLIAARCRCGHRPPAESRDGDSSERRRASTPPGGRRSDARCRCRTLSGRATGAPETVRPRCRAGRSDSSLFPEPHSSCHPQILDHAYSASEDHPAIDRDIMPSAPPKNPVPHRPVARCDREP